MNIDILPDDVRDLCTLNTLTRRVRGFALKLRRRRRELHLRWKTPEDIRSSRKSRRLELKTELRFRFEGDMTGFTNSNANRNRVLVSFSI